MKIAVVDPDKLVGIVRYERYRVPPININSDPKLDIDIGVMPI